MAVSLANLLSTGLGVKLCTLESDDASDPTCIGWLTDVWPWPRALLDVLQSV